MPDPSAAAVGTNPALDERSFLAEGASHLELGRPSSGSAQLNDDFVECVVFVSPPVPRRLVPLAERNSQTDEVDSLLY